MDFIGPDTDAVSSPTTSGGFVGPDSDVAPTQTPLESGVRGAVRNFPFAQQAVAGLSGVGNSMGLPTAPYSQKLQQMTDAAEQGKAQNKKAYYTGAGIGAVAPAFLPVVGEGLEALGPVAGGALQGAGQATSDTSVTQDPAKAVKQALIGGGIGGAVGGVGDYVGKQIGTAPELVAQNTEHTLDIPARRMATLLGKDVQGGLGDINETFQNTVLPDGRPLLELSDSAIRRAAKVEDAVDMYGKQIGEIVSQVKTDVPADALKKDIAGMAVGKGGLKVQNEALDKIQKIIDDNTTGGKISFDQLRGLKDEVYNEMVHVDPQTGSLLPGSRKAMQAWGYLKDLQDKIVQQEKPELFDKFTSANNNFSNLVGLQKGLNSVSLKEAAKQTNLGTNLNPLTLLSNVGKGAAKMIGANKFVNNLPMALNPAIQSVAKVLPSTAKGIPQAEITDYLSNKFGKGK